MRVSRPYRRPARGVYQVQVPMSFSRKDVTSTNWNWIKRSMLENVFNCYNDILGEVERDIRNKK
jgi:hypothetical protein